MEAPSATPGEEHLIDVRQLKKTYPDQEGEVDALRYIDVQLGRGEFVALIGKPGSGKSTLLDILAGAEQPTSGRVRVNGASPPKLAADELDTWRMETLGIVPSSLSLNPDRSVLDNVLLPMARSARLTERAQRERAQTLLEMVRLGGAAGQPLSELPHGYQKCASIACALANDPPLILADEPTAGMDEDLAAEVIDLFRRLAAEGKTILIATVDTSLASRVGCTLLIEDGEIVSEYLVRALHPLSPERLIELKKKYPPLNYAPRTPIIRQGDLGDSFFIIVEGHVDVFLDRPGDEPLLVNRLGPGSYFGEMAILLQDVRSATIRVAESERASLIEIKAPEFSALIEESPELQQSFEEILERRRIALTLQALAELDPEMIAGIAQEQEIQTFEPDEVVIQQGQIGRTFFVLIEGALDVLIERDREPLPVARLGPGQLFGEQALLGARRRNATVRAVGDQAAQVVELQAEDLRRLVGRSPVFRRSIQKNLDARTTTAATKREDLDLPES